MKPIVFQGKVQNGLAQLPRWCMLLGLFLLICGAKWWLINRFGNATPIWDDWAGEADILKRFIEGSLSPMQILASENEHRIAFSRVFWLLLFRIDRRWDPVFWMIAQAPIHALAITLFVRLAGTFMSGVGKASLAVFAACLGILPFGWENTLWCMEACVYGMILLGIAAIWLCWRHETLSARWWLGALLALGGLFTTAGGIFPVTATTLFLMARSLFERGKEPGKRFAGAAIVGAIAVFGVLITPRLPGSERLVAASFGSFFQALTGILSWPCDSHWACIVIQAPLLMLLLVLAFRRVRFNDGRWFVAIAGTAFWIQAVMTAYKRCEGWNASRYCDAWIMLLIIQFSSLYFLRGNPGNRRHIMFFPIAAVWLSVSILGALERSVNVLPRELVERHFTLLEMENNVREYLATRNSTFLQGKIPFPDAARFQTILDSDIIRSILPPNLIDSTPPLSPSEQKLTGSGFVRDGCPPGMPALNKMFFGSYGISGAHTQGGIALTFNVPIGTREADIQVAGYAGNTGLDLRLKDGRGDSYSIAPQICPGTHWQTVSINLNPKTTRFTLFGKYKDAEQWLAFSMPTISSGHAPGRWARSLAGGWFYVIDIGLVLMALGAVAGLKDVPETSLTLPAAPSAISTKPISMK